MGLWDFIYSGAETVTKGYNTSYYYSTTAVKNTADAVKNTADAVINTADAVKNIGQYVPDDEDRDRMVNFGTKFVKIASVYAAKEAANNIPGGRVLSQIYNETVREMKNESKKN